MMVFMTLRRVAAVVVSSMVARAIWLYLWFGLEPGAGGQPCPGLLILVSVKYGKVNNNW
jgi:hypothetical protein